MRRRIPRLYSTSRSRIAGNGHVLVAYGRGHYSLIIAN